MCIRFGPPLTKKYKSEWAFGRGNGKSVLMTRILYNIAQIMNEERDDVWLSLLAWIEAKGDRWN